MKKDFDWQYSDEKLLFKSHEHLFSFLVDKTHIFAVYAVLWLVLSVAVSLLSGMILFWWLTFLVVAFLWLLYLTVLYRNTWLIITPRRLVKLTQNGLFKKRRRELKLMDIKATDAKKSVIGTFLWYTELTIKWTESDTSIYFKGIAWGQDIANYIWRIIDYIKTNGHEDEISRYVPKKIRRQGELRSKR